MGTLPAVHCLPSMCLLRTSLLRTAWCKQTPHSWHAAPLTDFIQDVAGGVFVELVVQHDIACRCRNETQQVDSQRWCREAGRAHVLLCEPLAGPPMPQQPSKQTQTTKVMLKAQKRNCLQGQSAVAAVKFAPQLLRCALWSPCVPAAACDGAGEVSLTLYNEVDQAGAQEPAGHAALCGAQELCLACSTNSSGHGQCFS